MSALDSFAEDHRSGCPVRVLGEIPCDGGAMTFEEFAAGQLSEVLGFALVLTGDRASAEDIVQETLIRAHQHWDKIGGLDRPKFYIRKMVVNEFLSSRRRLGYSGFGITAITSNNCDGSAGPCPEIGLADSRRLPRPGHHRIRPGGQAR